MTVLESKEVACSSAPILHGIEGSLLGMVLAGKGVKDAVDQLS